MAIQAGTEQIAAALDDKAKMRLHIGVKVGDVIAEGDDLTGDNVFIASRIESLTAPGTPIRRGSWLIREDEVVACPLPPFAQNGHGRSAGRCSLSRAKYDQSFLRACLQPMRWLISWCVGEQPISRSSVCVRGADQHDAELIMMPNAPKPDERVGWELIWRHGNEHPRYGSYTAPDAAVVEWAATLAAGGFVLDLGCGVGRHVIHLGSCGFRMAGIDISPSGIRLAQEACADRRISFEWQVSDMTTLQWADRTFDAALSISTIHHLKREGIIRALGQVRRVLKPGGLLLVDFPCTDSLDYRRLRERVAAGQIAEIEPNTFVDQRPDIDEMDDDFLPHHYCDEDDLRDLLRPFEIIRLWTCLRKSQDNAGMRGKWIASVRRPLAG